MLRLILTINFNGMNTHVLISIFDLETRNENTFYSH
jgi:hypothetical protein